MNCIVKIKYLFISSDCLGRQKFCGIDVIPQSWSIDVIPQLCGMDVIAELLAREARAERSTMGKKIW